MRQPCASEQQVSWIFMVDGREQRDLGKVERPRRQLARERRQRRPLRKRPLRQRNDAGRIPKHLGGAAFEQRDPACSIRGTELNE